MDKAKIFFRNFVAAILAQTWVFGLFFSITKQLNVEKVLHTLPLIFIVATLYGCIQLLGNIFISNKTALRFLFIIPIVAVCIVGGIVAENSMTFYACGGAMLMAGYEGILREKKLERIRMSKTNGN